MLPAIASLLAFSFQGAPLPFVSPTFSDHMVLQRDRTNSIWGWTTPGSHVVVTVAGQKAEAVADRSGKWLAHFTPPPVGGPYTVSIDGPSHAELQDVLVGDVWICSGQSNMEFGVGNIPTATPDIENFNDPQMRLFTMEHAISFTPQPIGKGHWVTADPKSLLQVVEGNWNGFSAVGFYFGKTLRTEVNVPIGLVQTSWGGTIAESWTSEKSLRPLGDFNDLIDWVHQQNSGKSVPFSKQLSDWFAKNDPGEPKGFAKPDFDDSGWQKAIMPAAFEDVGPQDFDGLVWYRKSFDLAEAPTGPVTLHLGPIDDDDTTFLNGVPIGSMWVWNSPRDYVIPAGLLKAGHNVLAVRVLDTGGGGGFSKLTKEFGLSTEVGTKIDLSGEWSYFVGPTIKELKPAPQDPTGNPNLPTLLSNAMIEPLTPLAVKGAIWYQGESNAGRGAQYRRLLPTMIRDWRRRFHNDFPFYIVQLANYQVRNPEPVENDWAELREAQAVTANTLAKTGLAVAIDIGEREDIHPKNKKEVGRRLALVALHDTYGKDVVYSGPVAKKVTKLPGGVLAVEFAHTEGGLKVTGDKVVGFAIAGKYRRFRWAEGRIEGNRILLSCKDVPNPVYVRYGWDSDPEATVVNGEGLPAVPFRTDGPTPFNRPE